MDSVIFCRPNVHFEKRKTLLRSTGSFGTIEDNIIAPTPRKFPNLASCSPKYGRREKRKNDDVSPLFGEAGSEIQNILFHPQNLLAANHLVSIPSISTPLEESAPTIVPVKITPLRSSNPITLNSPFYTEQRSTIGGSNVDILEKKAEKSNLTIQIAANPRLYPANGRLRGNTHYHSARKELARSRSLSWPGNPKMEKAC